MDHTGGVRLADRPLFHDSLIYEYHGRLEGNHLDLATTFCDVGARPERRVDSHHHPASDRCERLYCIRYVYIAVHPLGWICTIFNLGLVPEGDWV